MTAEQISKANIDYIEAIREYTRPDLPSELGAMKEFKLRDNAEQSQQRLEQEIEVLRQNRPGLPKLLGRTPVNAGWSLNTSQMGRWKITFWNIEAVQLEHESFPVGCEHPHAFFTRTASFTATSSPRIFLLGTITTLFLATSVWFSCLSDSV